MECPVAQPGLVMFVYSKHPATRWILLRAGLQRQWERESRHCTKAEVGALSTSFFSSRSRRSRLRVGGILERGDGIRGSRSSHSRQKQDKGSAQKIPAILGVEFGDRDEGSGCSQCSNRYPHRHKSPPKRRTDVECGSTRQRPEHHPSQHQPGPESKRARVSGHQSLGASVREAKEGRWHCGSGGLGGEVDSGRTCSLWQQ